MRFGFLSILLVFCCFSISYAIDFDNNVLTMKQNVKKIESILELNISDFNDKNSYIGVQGFCCDNTNFYIALVTKNDKNYVEQETKILKINADTKQLVGQYNLGKVGHSNSLTYNENKKKILLGTCSKYKPYIIEFDVDFRNINKHFLMNEQGIKQARGINVVAYNKRKNQYIAGVASEYIACYSYDYKFLYKINDYNNMIFSGTTSQTFYADDYIYNVCGRFINNKKDSYIANYINVFDYNGKLQKYYLIGKELCLNGLEKVEIEQITMLNGYIFALANVLSSGKLRIYKLEIN